MIQRGHYPTRPLSELCLKLVNGQTPARNGYTDKGKAVVKVASLTRQWDVNWRKLSFTSEAFFNKAKKAYLLENDLLILCASHQLDYIGRNFALVQNIPAELSGNVMTVGELIIARANPQVVLPEYLLACFAIEPIQALVNRMTRVQSAHLYAEDLKNLRIPVPPLEVQELIRKALGERRTQAKRLRAEAERVVTEAKARVEQMILGEIER